MAWATPCADAGLKRKTLRRNPVAKKTAPPVGSGGAVFAASVTASFTARPCVAAVPADGSGAGVPDGTVHGRDHGLEGGRAGVGIDPHAPEHALAHGAFDVGGGQGAAALREGVFAVVQDPDVDAVLTQDAQQGSDGAVAGSGAADLGAVDLQCGGQGHVAVLIG